MLSPSRWSLLLCAALLATAPAMAEWFAPATPITFESTATGIIGAVPDGEGGMIVVFALSTAAGSGLNVQRIHSDGSRLWGPYGIEVLAPTLEFNFAGIASDGLEGAIVYWILRTGASSQRAYALRIDSTGSLPWGPTGVLLRSVYEQTGGLTVAAASDGLGGGIFAMRTNLLDEGDIIAQHVNPMGVAIWGADGRIVCDASGAQHSPALVQSDTGTAIISWIDFRVTGNPHVYAQRVSEAGNDWDVNGVAFCTAGQSRSPALICSDDTAGAYLVWGDGRSGGNGVYAQRVTNTGDELWAFNGERISAIAQVSLSAIIPNGNGGFYAAWSPTATENDILAQNVDPLGNRLWGSSGVTVCNALGTQGSPVLGRSAFDTDLFVVWTDERAGTGIETLYAQRVWSLTGQMLGPVNGRPITDGTRDVYSPRLVSDNSNGALVCFQAAPSGNLARSYADRVFGNGLTGPFLPRAISVVDRPDDQGGWVRVLLDAPWADQFMYLHTISGYNVWRLMEDPEKAADPMDSDAIDTAVQRSEHEPVIVSSAGDGQFPAGSWESLGFHPAIQRSSYTFLAPTTDDSTSSGSANQTYMVSAHTPYPNLYLLSDPASGHSIDDLPPAQPNPFTAVSSGSGTTGQTTLTWGANDESDFLQYELHRSAASDFVPAQANLLTITSTPGFVDIGSYGQFYKLAAVDENGNRSTYAVVSALVTAVPQEPALTLRLDLPRPHPVRGDTQIHFALPSAGAVSLAVYDVAGRCVRRLIEAPYPIGAHSVAWDGRDARGSTLASGVYHLRLQSTVGNRTLRVVLMR